MVVEEQCSPMIVANSKKGMIYDFNINYSHWRSLDEVYQWGEVEGDTSDKRGWIPPPLLEEKMAICILKALVTKWRIKARTSSYLHFPANVELNRVRLQPNLFTDEKKAKHNLGEKIECLVKSEMFTEHNS